MKFPAASNGNQVLCLLLFLSLALWGCSAGDIDTDNMAQLDINKIQKRADAGNAEAQYTLGMRYYEGRDVVEDKTEATKWYRKAAEQGQDLAHYNLG